MSEHLMQCTGAGKCRVKKCALAKPHLRTPKCDENRKCCGNDCKCVEAKEQR